MTGREISSPALRQLERWWLRFERERGALDVDAGDCLVLEPTHVARLLALELRAR